MAQYSMTNEECAVFLEGTANQVQEMINTNNTNPTSNQLKVEAFDGAMLAASPQNQLKRFLLLCERRNNLLRDIEKIAGGQVNDQNIRVRTDTLNHSREMFFKVQELIDVAECSDATGRINDMFRQGTAQRCSQVCEEFLEKCTLSSSTSNVTNKTNTICMPAITVPKYNGEVTEWSNFKKYFDNLVHNNPNISDINKLHYLKAALTGPAAEVVKGVDLSNEGYRTAYDLLTSQYSNTQRVATAHYKILASHRLPPHPTANDYFNLANSHTAAMAGLREQGIADLTDYMGLQLTLNSLDLPTRTAFEASLAPNTFPTSEAFRSFLNEKARLLETIRSIDNPPEKRPVRRPTRTLVNPEEQLEEIKTTNIQAEIEKKLRNPRRQNNKACFFCNSQYHMLYGCPHFHALGIKQRFEYVAKHTLCLNCFGMHLLKDCKTLQGCKRCGHRTHHTLLHEMTAPSVPHINQNNTANRAAEINAD
jgi:hypothetical protein